MLLALKSKNLSEERRHRILRHGTVAILIMIVRYVDGQGRASLDRTLRSAMRARYYKRDHGPRYEMTAVATPHDPLPRADARFTGLRGLRVREDRDRDLARDVAPVANAVTFE
jgi:hypothetical protein